ncbi:hypothetical protein SNEBB_005512 [Seison nebaliae]|nr:hypothetical protein SNEBB_005512 [Seison nebaliae]
MYFYHISSLFILIILLEICKIEGFISKLKSGLSAVKSKLGAKRFPYGTKLHVNFNHEINEIIQMRHYELFHIDEDASCDVAIDKGYFLIAALKNAAEMQGRMPKYREAKIHIMREMNRFCKQHSFHDSTSVMMRMLDRLK